jgi:hypothetical protein
MRRSEVWLINLDPTVGAEIMKTRPAVIVSDDAIGVLPLKAYDAEFPASTGLGLSGRRCGGGAHP